MQPTNTIHIAILDDHQIIVDGLKLVLQNKENIEVVYDCTDGNKLIEHLKQGQASVNLLIMDLMMPAINGYEMALILQEQFPGVKIIILSMNTEIDLAYKLIEETDIKGYLPKSVDKNILLEAIYKVSQGDFFIHDDILRELEGYKINVFAREQLMLSPRELQIVKLICEGAGNKGIAEQLFLSEHTVATHRKNIYKKTGCHKSVALAELATRLKLW